VTLLLASYPGKEHPGSCSFTCSACGRRGWRGSRQGALGSAGQMVPSRIVLHQLFVLAYAAQESQVCRVLRE